MSDSDETPLGFSVDEQKLFDEESYFHPNEHTTQLPSYLVEWQTSLGEIRRDVATLKEIDAESGDTDVDSHIFEPRPGREMRAELQQSIKAAASRLSTDFQKAQALVELMAPLDEDLHDILQLSEDSSQAAMDRTETVLFEGTPGPIYDKLTADGAIIEDRMGQITDQAKRLKTVLAFDHRQD